MNWRLIVLGILTVMMTTVSFYYITAYTPTFGRQVLKLAPTDNLLVTMCVGFSNLLWQLISGMVSDRIGRRPILIACTVLALLTAYPALSWLVAARACLRSSCGCRCFTPGTTAPWRCG